jgi:hypothetical protein
VHRLETAWESSLPGSNAAGASKRLSHNFLRAYENALSFDTNPLYAILHEAIYNQVCTFCVSYKVYKISKWTVVQVGITIGLLLAESVFVAVRHVAGCGDENITTSCHL